MKTPDVSIIIPVYNAGIGLRETLARIDQTRTDSSEVIIIDDGSTDGTPEFVSEYASPRSYVQAFRLDRNSGVAAARNLGLGHARGEYVWFVDWDDEWRNDILRVMLTRARSTRADVVVCRSTWRLDSGLDVGIIEGINADVSTASGRNALDLVLAGDLKGYLWSKLLRRELLPEAMFPAMRSRSDFCGLVPQLVAARHIAFEPTVLYHHVIRSGSITNSKEPNLDDLAEGLTVVKRLSDEMPPSRRRKLLLLRFEYIVCHVARVDTALRLSSKEAAQRELKIALRGMSYRDIARIAIVSPEIAVRSALVKALGRQYPFVRRTFIENRQRLRSVRVGKSTS